VCQETFLRAFRALPGFRGQAKFSSWLYRIALNLCRDWVRRERRTPVVQPPEDVDLMDLAAAAEPSESIEDLVARKDLARLVERAMACLPEDQRTAIVLKEYHGLTFRGFGRLSAEHGKNQAVPGVDGAAPRAREKSAIGRPGPAGMTI
jgi:RNA polymerase sigma-70 factor (ECF subfamily)